MRQPSNAPVTWMQMPIPLFIYQPIARILVVSALQFSNCFTGDSKLCSQFSLLNMSFLPAFTQVIFQNNHNEPLHHA